MTKHSHGKSPFLIGKPSIFMGHFPVSDGFPMVFPWKPPFSHGFPMVFSSIFRFWGGSPGSCHCETSRTRAADGCCHHPPIKSLDLRLAVASDPGFGMRELQHRKSMYYRIYSHLFTYIYTYKYTYIYIHTYIDMSTDCWVDIKKIKSW